MRHDGANRLLAPVEATSARIGTDRAQLGAVQAPLSRLSRRMGLGGGMVGRIRAGRPAGAAVGRSVRVGGSAGAGSWQAIRGGACPNRRPPTSILAVLWEVGEYRI